MIFRVSPNLPTQSIESRLTSFPVLSGEQQTALLAHAKHHPLWYIRAVMYLVGTLHTRHHVSFSACGLILRCLNLLFEKAPSKSLLGPPPMAQTLTTVLSKLELKDGFTVHPTCFRCHRIFDAKIAVNASCEACDETLFDIIDQEPVDEDAQSLPLSVPIPKPKQRTPKPITVTPIQLPSQALADFFERPGMFRAVNAWKTRMRIPGEMRCMQDGAVWSTIRGVDNESFFYGPGSEDEIRLGVTLSLDWYHHIISHILKLT